MRKHIFLSFALTFLMTGCTVIETNNNTTNGCSTAERENGTCTDENGNVIKLTSISVDTLPTKLDYVVGETFNPEGMVVKATYSNGTSKVITDYTYDLHDALKLTDTKVTITYKTKTVEISITVTEGDPSNRDYDPYVADGTIVSLDSVKTKVEKAKTFKTRTLEYLQDGDSYDIDFKYKRCEDFYVYSGSIDWAQDMWDNKTDAMGYVGFPKDGSIDEFYELNNIDTVHATAKHFTIPTDDKITGRCQLTYDEALEKLDKCDYDLPAFLDSQYDFMIGKTSKAEALSDVTLSEDKLIVTAPKENESHIHGHYSYSLLSVYINIYYDLYLTFNADGSINNAKYTRSYLDDDATVKVTETYEVKDITYGDYVSVDSLDWNVFEPKQYYIQNIYDIDFSKVLTYTPASGASDAHTTIVGAAFDFLPYDSHYLGFAMFKYSPSTAIGTYDVGILDSSDKNVITEVKQDDGSTLWEAVGVGKTTLTIGSLYSDLDATTVEITVDYAKVDSISWSKPYSLGDAVCFTNTNMVVDANVNPYCAQQDMEITVKDESVLSCTMNDDGYMVIRGKKIGKTTIVLTSVADPKISRSLDVTCVGELNGELIEGSYDAPSSLATYTGYNFTYEFNSDNTGVLHQTTTGNDGNEVKYDVPFTYTISEKDSSIQLTPGKDWTIPQSLRYVYFYNLHTLHIDWEVGEYVYAFDLIKE